MSLKFLLRNPYISQIELTNACNLSCPMCPRTNHMDRKIEFMDFNLFKMIIQDLNNINPYNGGIQIQLHHFGDSILHPDLEKFLKYCKAYKIVTMISSNGTLLTKEKREAIIDNLAVLWISFDSINKETYEKMRKGASFEKTISNITNLMIEKGDRRPDVILSSLIDDNKEEYEAFWKERGVKNILFKNYHSWRNEPDVKEFTGIQKVITNDPCMYLSTSFCVLVDGRVVPCCMDYNGEMILGDLKYQSIGEIWYGGRYKALRTRHYNKEKENINLCRGCTEYPHQK